MSHPNYEPEQHLAPSAPPAATADLLDRVYDDLRSLANHYMQRERAGHTLSPTAVVHEVYLRLAQQDKDLWPDRSQFLSVASRMIRRVLVDHARARNSEKRSGYLRVSLHGVDPSEPSPEVDFPTIDDALNQLAALSERQAHIAELRYFGGLGIDETAQLLGVSPGTVKAEWRLARAWLAAKLA